MSRGVDVPLIGEIQRAPAPQRVVGKKKTLAQGDRLRTRERTRGRCSEPVSKFERGSAKSSLPIYTGSRA